MHPEPMSPDENEPDWDEPLSLALTPGELIHALFPTASSVHTGWSSCVENHLVTADLFAMDERSGNYTRLAEQEFEDSENRDILWHDWTVEVRIGEVVVTGHWQIQVTAAPIDWEWCTREAEGAFEKASLLVGKRIRRALAVEEATDSPPQAAPRHH